MRLTTETFARRRTPMPRPMSAPMPLPLLPELKAKEEERRRGAIAAPSLPGAAPVFTAHVGAATGNPYLWLAKTFLRTLLRNGLPSTTFPVAAIVLAGLSLGFAYGGLVHEPASPAASSVFIPHPVAPFSAPIRTAPRAPSSTSMVLGDPVAKAPESIVAEAPSPASEVPAEQEAAVEAPAPVIPAVEDVLQDSLGPLKPRAGRRSERISWGGQSISALPAAGGEFRPMRSPAAVKAAAAASARRNGRPTLRRISANQKLRSSRLAKGSAQRAMGQLKLASRLSAASSQAPSVEAVKQGGSDAFEQGRTVGGEGLSLDASPTTGLGASAPDVTEASAPALPAGENVTPYQDKVDSAKQKNKMTMVMMILGAILIAAGTILLMMEEPTQTMKAIGWALIGAGAALIVAGMLAASQAKDDGKKVADEYGQTEQGEVIDDCADQSLGKTDCAPKSVAQPTNGVHEAVEAESKAGYTLGAEGAQGGN